MKVWRLVAHHLEPERAIERSITNGKLAVGWGKIGDLRTLNCRDAHEITNKIGEVYPFLKNSQHGGPSLWNFFSEMREGDLVIVAAGGKRHFVAEVVGPYVWMSEYDSFDDYYHQRPIVMLDEHPDDVWAELGRGVVKGQNIQWTVALCGNREPQDLVRPGVQTTYSEGTRYDIVATGIERNAAARAKCIEHHGYSCAVCDLDFGNTYGELGRGFIHVHHLQPIAEVEGVREVDPIKDLIPLCPNCHAMVHRTRPPLTIDALRKKYLANSS